LIEGVAVVEEEGVEQLCLRWVEVEEEWDRRASHRRRLHQTKRGRRVLGEEDALT